MLIMLFSCGEPTDSKTDTSEENKSKENQVEEEVYDADPTVFKLLTAEESGIKFANKVDESNEANILDYEYMYNGAGVGVGDINNDGLEDLFFTGNMVSDRLYLNRGNLKFQNISKKAGVQENPGWSAGVSMVDINRDGWLDIYVCRTGPFPDPAQKTNLLFINNKDLTFTESAKEYGLDYAGYTSQAAFFDYDRDGDLDAYLLTHPKDFTRKMNTKILKEMEAKGTIELDHFYRNDNGKFVDITKEAGILSSGYGLGISVSDFNGDGWQDVFVSNDYAQGDYMWINNQNGTFTNEALERLKHTAHSSMGCDVADINNDGLQDFMAVDMAFESRERSKRNMATMDIDKFHGFVKVGWNYEYMKNVLQLNNGMGQFNDVAQVAGISSTDWSWAPLFADYDNDGWQDLFVSNGYKRDVNDNDFANNFKAKKSENNGKMTLEDALELIPTVVLKNYIFSNNKDLTFERRNKDWGLREKVNTNGAAYSDLDNDGDLDLILNNLESKAFVYKNMSNDSGNTNYLSLKLTGDDNMDATGALVKIISGGKQMIRENYTLHGYLSSMGQKLHFGLGDMKSIDSLIIYWPNGKVKMLQNVAANQTKELKPSDGMSINAAALEKKTKAYLTEYAAKSGLEFNHVENVYDDFATEILLPHKMSEHGPHSSVGDINGDGLEDIFIGGSAGTASSIFFQQPNGKFSRAAHPVFDQDKSKEDIGSVIFDCDMDGDMDLYVVSGGNEFPHGSDKYEDRLYINEGDGNITKSTSLPSINSSGSRVIAFDYDKDGDEDLIVGGRVKAQLYPHNPTSYVLNNDKGNFTIVTNDVIPGFENCGMVTDLKTFDYNGDGLEDLLVVGEWMSPKIYKNTNGEFEDVSANVIPEHSTGWWFSSTVGDFDGDGDMDFLGGNVGMNNKFHPSAKKPFKVYADDFDDNGTNDIVLAKYDGSMLYPVRGKECSTEQMPFVSQKFPTYEGFANATLEDVFTPQKLALAFGLSVDQFHSGIFWNDGGKFRFEDLPHEAQTSTIQDVIYKDVNGDKIDDLIIVGNMFGAEVETTKYDGSDGLILINDGKGNFSPISGRNSGLNVPYNTRDISTIITTTGEELLLITASNGPLMVYKM
ncbi:MAG: hypothetical protein ACI8XB_000099 [Patiriisocius sp.]|jgi:hypothetical protein